MWDFSQAGCLVKLSFYISLVNSLSEHWHPSDVNYKRAPTEILGAMQQVTCLLTPNILGNIWWAPWFSALGFLQRPVVYKWQYALSLFLFNVSLQGSWEMALLGSPGKDLLQERTWVSLLQLCGYRFVWHSHLSSGVLSEAASVLLLVAASVFCLSGTVSGASHTGGQGHLM